MLRAVPRPQSFESGSRVLDYWLVHAEGFRVGGRRIRAGSVASVVVEEDGLRARALLIRGRGLRRYRVVPVAEVASVTPAEATVTLRRGRRDWSGLQARVAQVATVLAALALALAAWVRAEAWPQVVRLSRLALLQLRRGKPHAVRAGAALRREWRRRRPLVAARLRELQGTAVVAVARSRQARRH